MTAVLTSTHRYLLTGAARDALTTTGGKVFLDGMVLAAPDVHEVRCLAYAGLLEQDGSQVNLTKHGRRRLSESGVIR